ncbi:Cof-type HAD-IIB family hydrolase [Aquibacillus sp. 3ASR75-11]|uniref:Cof-type HAD-IIB family hydrolase n=1 Tax=Terrihalobacillus insolitus TaxID=2950438 RepID=A0A9X3WQQ1_9BACI|nr:HAD family hydrolase [Terrihalobacillus insolitus]MDC3414052.1 Cof-type HAD-IIB family hydrolase [Terrihalobacillus insolitus]MDC3424142.1 Cof-type HAD-IIB family hydrolase [Terrihalobacillus insolitus]
MKNNYRILFLDIDGTLVTPDDTIQQSTKSAIRQVQDKGIKVFLATGRPLHEIREIGKELNIDSYIGYNGAFAIHKEKEILNEPMDTSTIEHFIDIANQQDNDLVFYTNGKNVFTSLDKPMVKKFMQKFNLRKNELYTPTNDYNVLGVTLIDLKDGDIDHYTVNDHMYFSEVNIKGFRNNYDVIRETANKGFAVKAILDNLSISPEHAIAFGDGMNDKEMLRVVGEGFAMGNANPNLFEYANHTTTAVTESGIYNGLKSLGLVE